jgi:RIO kinase 2
VLKNPLFGLIKFYNNSLFSFEDLIESLNMKLDPKGIRYISDEGFRVLTAVEMGCRNHEIVPINLISTIAKLKAGIPSRLIGELLRYKLIHKEANVKYEGFGLTYGGYDYLALNTFYKRDVIYSMGQQIGVGKESDIYVVANKEGEQYVLKIHR